MSPGVDPDSESASAVEKNEDHSGASQSDQRKGGEVGDQMEVDAHGRKALRKKDLSIRLRGLPTPLDRWTHAL